LENDFSAGSWGVYVPNFNLLLSLGVCGTFDLGFKMSET